MTNSEHLQFIHDRLVNEHGENPDVDYLIKFREIIAETKKLDDGFNDYLKFLESKSKSKGVHQPNVDNTSTPPAKKPEVFNPETKKTQKLFCEETLVPTWTVRYEDPTRGNKGEALYMTVSAETEWKAKEQALGTGEFTKHLTPEFWELKYLTAFRATGNYVIGKVEYFEGDPRL